ncbi:glycosyltransferase [Actinoplanes sp. TFC3]|uniref:glycosyltransferase n=1 Tax=Actinoplanes sp. TFC3 TaxID=1710355 RepID=UPI000A3E693F|nr:glycosyltransferase [Actinoplanes sp. TFC3]
MKRLVMLAKSPWNPAIRREHALAQQARAHGLLVDYIEAPADIRQLGGNSRSWLTNLWKAPNQRGILHPRSTLVPGHRSPLAASVDNQLLGRTVRALCADADPRDVAVVVNVPWQWEATAGVPCRRVFDAADDWNRLLNGRRPHVGRLYQQIADEADAVIVANEHLAELFPGRQVDFVPNGTQADLVDGAAAHKPGMRRMVYVGTFSERFDVDLVSNVLTLLPDWTLDLFGECRYAGYGDQPAPEFAQLLENFGPRVSWNGVLQRSDLGALLNNASVALVPHRAQFCHGQSSMKFLDYAARGCPVVSTRWEADLDRQAPPGVWFADAASAFAEAVCEADDIDAVTTESAIAWARAQTWDQRWPLWAGAVFGAPATSTP